MKLLKGEILKKSSKNYIYVKTIVLESIQSMTRFQQNYKMSPRGSEKLVENGISKFCRNLLDKINKGIDIHS